tara:strand:+ start:1003 stop:1281 length:279 start_codon:yes stop_codon:yes gene_type:complete
LSSPHAPSPRIAGGRQGLSVRAAGLDFAELETAASQDEDDDADWVAPVVRRRAAFSVRDDVARFFSNSFLGARSASTESLNPENRSIPRAAS